MTRGNARDLAREKQAKQQAAKSKSQKASDRDGNAGLTHEQRKYARTQRF